MHNQQQQYYFYRYINEEYKHPLLRLLIEKHKKGLNIREVVYTNMMLSKKNKKESFHTLLLSYLIIHRKENDGYITNLIKELLIEVDFDEYVESFDEHYKELNTLLEYLELPTLDKNPQIEKNIFYFQTKS